MSCVFAPINDYRNYLSHHGVKGQRWGVRNAEWYPIDAYKAHLKSMGKTAKDYNDGTGVGSRMKIRGEMAVKNVKDIVKNTAEAKGVINKASNLIGHRAAETSRRNSSVAQERLANASNTKLFKHLHNTKAINKEYAAEYHATKAGQSLSARAFETIIPITLINTPYKSVFGGTVSIGEKALATAIGGPVGNLALEAAFSNTRFAKETGQTDYIQRQQKKSFENAMSADQRYAKSQEARKKKKK